MRIEGVFEVVAAYQLLAFHRIAGVIIDPSRADEQLTLGRHRGAEVGCDIVVGVFKRGVQRHPIGDSKKQAWRRVNPLSFLIVIAPVRAVLGQCEHAVSHAGMATHRTGQIDAGFDDAKAGAL